jgi:hypothetical protein
MTAHHVNLYPLIMIDKRFKEYDRPGIYEIRVKGYLNDRWASYFDGLTITLEDDGYTLLTGPVADQPALYGLLKRVRNLGLPLISVNCINPDATVGADIEQSVE